LKEKSRDKTGKTRQMTRHHFYQMQNFGCHLNRKKYLAIFTTFVRSKHNGVSTLVCKTFLEKQKIKKNSISNVKEIRMKE